jgi:hypothetical protein
MEMDIMPASKALFIMLSLKGPSNMPGKRVNISKCIPIPFSKTYQNLK